ncbi:MULTISPECIES: MmgE/PrpD family protein [unclassified Rhizobium]|uniref:MmgE/PrpD family protein n=1 Tax=unclassified Rhizobium TaxID=2613769 RepID=UPI001783FD4F|nr:MULTISPECIES: MmgE/PrpD family protein [unclassified Rhizobium]MBD8689599.1 MmgE/PrpD family protein [Rhizobium sp. CFBP 13644]MBD8694206.1 MmgE/PrpD family protein [Rhizobium sp. CFBP 13717]
MSETFFPHVTELASYVVTAGKSAPLKSARDAALQCVFDLIIAAAVGTKDVGPTAIRTVSSTIFGPGEVAIWFTGQTSSVIGAAWANASSSAALDLDDGNRFARGHPGAAIIPVAFAVGLEVEATFEQILNSIVVGYEVGVAVGSARTTYGSSGTWTAYGVVATAAVLRSTPLEQIEHAFAIAGESAPIQAFAGGPSPRVPAPEGAAVKEGIPWSVVTGLTALYMAEAGHTGPRNILESARHYTFPKKLALGEALHICQTYFKPYACCRHIHAPLEALRQLLMQHNIKATEIDSIEVRIHGDGMRISNRPRPGNLIDVQYSIPYCLAAAALHGFEVLTPVTFHTIKLEGAKELAARVSLFLDEQLHNLYPKKILAQVTVVCGDKRYESKPTAPKGEPLMKWDELEQKFRSATRFVGDEEWQDTLIAAIHDTRRGSFRQLQNCLAATNL